MVFVSLTRLRIRSLRFVPLFAWDTILVNNQVKKAPGFLIGALLSDRHWTFWTMTAWDSQESMRAFMTSGPHKKAMPRLLHWCDEASVAHWTQPDASLPSWIEAEKTHARNWPHFKGAPPQHSPCGHELSRAAHDIWWAASASRRLKLRRQQARAQTQRGRGLRPGLFAHHEVKR